MTDSGGGERRSRDLRPARRTQDRPAPPPETPDPRPASEQKLDQYRRRRHDVLHLETEAGRGRGAGGPAGARERLEGLLDPGSFVELDLFAAARATGPGMEERRAPGDAVVVGTGTIEGRDVAVYAFDPDVLGGSLGEVTAEKIVKVQDLALRSRIPIIGIVDSVGARIHEGVPALAGCAGVIYRNVRSSGVIPQLSAIVGPCADGAVHSPALADFVFMVAGAGRMFVTGPEVVRVTSGEDVTADDLGGARVHGTVSGVAHFLADGEAECWATMRRLLSYLPASSGETPPVRPASDDRERADPDLQTLLPDRPDLPYDMREVVNRVLDDGEFLEVHALFAPNVLVGFGRLDGQPVGVVANQPRVLAGAIDVDASVKAARFIRFCDAFNVPLVSLIDAPGFLPGTAQEHAGIVRHAAKLLYAYAEATVPKLAVITRRDYGGAYLAMSPRQMGADLNLAWPSAQIAVSGPEAAVDVVHRRELDAAGDPGARRAELVAGYTRRFANPYVAAERGYLDDVIEPRDTRRALIRGLELCLRKTVERPTRKHGNIPL